LSQRKISQELSVSRSTIRKVIGGVEVYTDSHLKKEPTEVKKIVEIPTQPEWVFDIEVETGRIMSGVGNVVISNSPRRGTNFVTNKVVKAAVRIKLGLQDKLYLGNLDATRDWGHAKDYCQAMWLMLQTDKPDDYVCATGISHSVRELCEYTFNRLGLDYNDYVMMDEKHLRPEELHDLKGDSSKLRNELGWKPKYTFETMLDEMIQYWLDYYKK
jgi:GDP-mannose 4,6-dehydratase